MRQMCVNYVCFSGRTEGYLELVLIKLNNVIQFAIYLRMLFIIK